MKHFLNFTLLGVFVFGMVVSAEVLIEMLEGKFFNDITEYKILYYIGIICLGTVICFAIGFATVMVYELAKKISEDPGDALKEDPKDS